VRRDLSSVSTRPSGQPSSTVSESEEYIELANHVLGDLRKSFVNALSRVVERPQEHDFTTLRLSHLWITPDEFTQFKTELEALGQRYANRRGMEGEREVSLAIVASEPGPVTDLDSADEAESPTSAHSLTQTGALKPHKTWVAGAVGWHTAELQAVLDRGETLDITVLGVCSFTNDVSPELAERAITRFYLHGKLVASPEVREVLKTKEPAFRHSIA
jgi:Ribbon-Helix-Helix transcriptional regulator family